jgi:hypothetical protein
MRTLVIREILPKYHYLSPCVCQLMISVAWGGRMWGTGLLCVHDKLLKDRPKLPAKYMYQSLYQNLTYI